MNSAPRRSPETDAQVSPLKTDSLDADYRKLKWMAYAAAFLQVGIGGLRFVDGSMLIQFSTVGFQAELSDFSQYLFDSPLKIALLSALGFKSAIAVGLTFLVLNLLPLVAIWATSQDARERAILLFIFASMPTWKIMFQNVGVGDSFILACTIVLVLSRQLWAVAFAAACMVLWHLQQGLLICAIMLCLLARCQRDDRWERSVYILAGLTAALMIILFLKAFILPTYSGRLQFIFTHMAPFLQRNMLYFPIALCTAISGALLVFEVSRLAQSSNLRKLTHIGFGLAVPAFAVASLTTDVSRAFVLLTFPIVLFLVNPQTIGMSVYDRLIASRAPAPLLFCAAFAPVLSWSGIDYYLWSTLWATLQKY